MSNLTTKDRLKELLPQLFAPPQVKGDYYLRFQLTAEISGLIDLTHVRESLIVPSGQITAIPNLPEYVLGLMSSRSQVFLVVDLAQMAGFPPEAINLRQYQIIIVKTTPSIDGISPDEPNLFGLAVRRILGISPILPDAFSSSVGEIPDVLTPFVEASVWQNNQRSLLIDIPQLIANCAIANP